MGIINQQNQNRRPYEITDIKNLPHSPNTAIVEVLLLTSKNNLRLVLTVTDIKQTPIETQIKHYINNLPQKDYKQLQKIDRKITNKQLQVVISGLASI